MSADASPLGGVGKRASVPGAAGRGRQRIPPIFFGIPFGLAGLAHA
ncbi:hypothetical protein GCM10010121_087940 [Streptomyces brasiliensis]|uniref:Uncharacterized protein n=1 Tax=Streptomyces brasiliensis TaxID=1954 RepID=A0A917P698_9ACTN|nr:hypothetical protein GCM10010121_087940 [Streptomyces brasiliensis]